MIRPNRWKFQWRYWRRETPWDTQVTPPEVMEFIARTPPGSALDLREDFSNVRTAIGEENGKPSSWYWLQRR